MGAFFFSLVNVMFNGIAELSMTVFRFPVFYKQMVSFFFLSCFGFLITNLFILRIPLSFICYTDNCLLHDRVCSCCQQVSVASDVSVS